MYRKFEIEVFRYLVYNCIPRLLGLFSEKLSIAIRQPQIIEN